MTANRITRLLAFAVIGMMIGHLCIAIIAGDVARALLAVVALLSNLSIVALTVQIERMEKNR